MQGRREGMPPEKRTRCVRGKAMGALTMVALTVNFASMDASAGGVGFTKSWPRSMIGN